jgi:PHD/YefM family antitoxin component YafN of YafNO toxin-antitoxin module
MKYHWTMKLTAVPQFRSSELSRNAPRVFDAAERHPVSVTRRDGEDLVLMSSREASDRELLLELAAQLIAITADSRTDLTQRLSQVYPWMRALSPTDKEQCANDLFAAVEASLATGKAHLAISELTSWRETANAIAAGLGQDPVEWLSDNPIVERP